MVVSELRGEKIDIIPYNDEPARFVAKALSPARVREVLVDDEARQATVVVPDDQLSLAIGREGQNARLAARLTGWRIDIKSETEFADRGARRRLRGARSEDGGRCAAILGQRPALPQRARCRARASAACASTRRCARFDERASRSSPLTDERDRRPGRPARRGRRRRASSRGREPRATERGGSPPRRRAPRTGRAAEAAEPPTSRRGRARRTSRRRRPMEPAPEAAEADAEASGGASPAEEPAS